MRRLLLPLVVVLALAFSAGASARTVFFIKNGHGWGHGIGMSQYGAQGFALHGATWQAILGHYYPRTGLWQRGTSTTVAVTLASGASSVRIGSASAFTVDGRTVAAGLYRVHASSGRVAFTSSSGTTRRFASPADVRAGASALQLGTRLYRGRFVVDLVGSGVSVVNRVGLESYLRGVVPCEAIPSWDFDALAAQAVAARSYALFASGGLSADTRSQVYCGKSSETPATNAAVTGTKGYVVVFPSGSHSILQTFFYSTSGGKTCSYADCGWGGTPAYAYPSVPDPYDSISPVHHWGPLRYTASAFARKLGASGSSLRDATVVVNSSSRVASMTVYGQAGSTTLSGATVRTRLDLRSTWFRVGVLRLRASAVKVRAGAKVTLSGFARRMGSTVTLEQRAAHGRWQLAGRVGVSNHRFAAVAHPFVTTYYRARVGNQVGPTVKVAVT